MKLRTIEVRLSGRTGGFAKYVGMNASQVRQYASGVRRPTEQKKEQLNAAIKELIKTLNSESRAFGID